MGMRSVDEILQRMQEIGDADDLTEVLMDEYETCEADLQVARRQEGLRGREAAYRTPARSEIRVPGSESDVEYAAIFDRFIRTGDTGALAELRAQSAGVGSEGGFTVPETFRQKLTDRLVDFGGLASVSEVISTAGGEKLRWPTLDDTVNTGVIAAENTAPTGGADLVFGEKELNAFRYIAPGAGALPLRVSVELLQDSAVDVQSLVTRKLGERIARQQAADWVHGTGVGQPLGIAGGALATSSFTAAAAMPTTHNQLIDAMSAVDPAYHPGAVFVVSFSAWQTLRKLVDADNRPILQPNQTSSIGSAPGFQLEGHPVIVDSSFDDFANPGLGLTNEWGVFGDIRETYVVRRVRDLQLIVDPFGRANEGQVQFTLWARADATIQNDFSAVVLTIVGA